MGIDRVERRAHLGYDERGIALPMAMMTLLLFSSLSLALVSLAQTEPTIASNHLLAARARAMAESGIERALWALGDPTAAGAFGGGGTPPNVTIGVVANAPYDGSAFVALSPAGGFRLTIAGTDPNLRAVRSRGVVPTDDPQDARTKSRSEIVATVARVRNLAHDLPCVLCAGSPLTLATVVVDARGSQTTDCGAKVAAAGATSVQVQAEARLFGADAPVDATAPLEGRDWLGGRGDAFLPSSDDIDTLRALAIWRGTYLRMSSDARVDLEGVRSGLVFVDSPEATNAITPTNVARVAIGPAFAVHPPFRGWLVVNGDVTLTAGADIAGLIYAANTVVAEGPATVTGMVVARQALGSPGAPVGGLRVRFDCIAARGSGLLPSGWFIRPGTYCDGTAGC
jgi:hypothetical protein